MKIFFILFFQFNILKGFSIDELLNNTYNYRNELCSYNGEPFYNETTNTVSCNCGKKFTNEPSKEKRKYINGHLIQCSYERKSRFMVVFFALFIPLGIEYYYLKRYNYFTTIFILSILVLVLNIISFVINYEINMKSKETKIQSKINKLTNKDNNPNINKDNKWIKRLMVISKTLGIIYIFYIIFNVIGHGAGFITDSNKVKTENDFLYMFDRPD